MDRRERAPDAVESVAAALDGRQSAMWTALPGIFVSFDPAKCTAVVQPAIQAEVAAPDGTSSVVSLPVLLDVPVVFPHGGGFALTFPIKRGDECLVVFASRCVDAWWQSGDVQPQAEQRMHDLSDGFAVPGPWSQPERLVPQIDAANVQLRTDDGAAHITMMPDYTIRAQNPAANVELTPQGVAAITASREITLTAPRIRLNTRSLYTTGYGGGRAVADLDMDIHQIGWHRSTGDQIAATVSQAKHTHTCPGCGETSGPSGGA